MISRPLTCPKVSELTGCSFPRADFSLAKAMLAARPAPLDRSTIESIVLAASVEFYENAETGNLHEGDMKLAYNWSVAVSVLRVVHFSTLTSCAPSLSL